MEPLFLKKPVLKLKHKALDYKNEHLKAEETELHGGALLGSLPYEEWLATAIPNSKRRKIWK